MEISIKEHSTHLAQMKTNKYIIKTTYLKKLGESKYE